MSADVKGDAYEGLLQKNAEDVADDADHSWGNYSFYVQVVMNDSFETEATSDVKSGPRVRNRPNLFAGAVDPSDGNEGTAFDFEVMYTDLLNLAPSSVSPSK